MKKSMLMGALLASALSLSACGGENKAASNTSTATSNAAAPAGGSAPASGNSAAPAGGAAATGDTTNQNFTLNNRSQNTVSHVYVSAVGDEQWGEDIMGQDVLAPGQSVQIEFPREESQCNWDVRVTIDGDQNAEIRNVNLCQTTEVNYQ